jgi:Mrp family chromosome partitioning ATPase
VDGLWLLPAGPSLSDPSKLFTSPKFPELIQAVRENYDYVLIDTAPLLVVSDPCVVASWADRVLLALRLTKDVRRRAMRAKEILDTLEARPVGVVVNGIGGAGSRGYPYEAYGYQVAGRQSP